MIDHTVEDGPYCASEEELQEFERSGRYFTGLSNAYDLTENTTSAPFGPSGIIDNEVIANEKVGIMDNRKPTITITGCNFIALDNYKYPTYEYSSSLGGSRFEVSVLTGDVTMIDLKVCGNHCAVVDTKNKLALFILRTFFRSQ